MANDTATVAARYWSAHTHTRHSVDDALPAVDPLAERAVELGYPALGITDHGNMAAACALYLAGKRLDLPVLPGVEMYLTSDHALKDRRSMHLTMLAYTGEGYRNLVALHNQAHRQFYHRPRLDMADLAAASEAGMTAGIAIGTGCRSGPVVRSLTDFGVDAAAQVVRALSRWFPRVYVELMDHGFKADGMTDGQIYDVLVAIAEEEGLPTILTGDAHYVMPEDKAAHDALKTLVTFAVDPEDGKFNGEGYYLPSTEEMRELHPFGWEGLADLAAAAKVKIPELDTFSLKIPDVTFGKDPNAVLEEQALASLEAFCTDLTGKYSASVYRARVIDELAVIKATEMAPYLLLVKMITDFMEERGIWYYARGSVAGSLVCYLLGISNTDPIFWQIRMERFLSGDRTSPPDIDLDIEHVRRAEVMAMLEEMGYEVVQVGTQLTYGLDAEEDTESGEGQGSLRVKYYGRLRKEGQSSLPWAEVPRSDKDMLYDLADRNLVSGVGAHPGGYVVASNAQVVGCLPIVGIDSSGTKVTAWRKGEVEAAGFPKIDLLGSKVLTAVKLACMAVEETDDPVHAKKLYRWIPLDDKETIKRIAAGKTAGLFQLSGWTQRTGLAELKPRKTLDVVASQALFRPAPLNSGFTKSYLDRRHKKAEVPTQHDDIASETKDTYGIALYQEQVVGLLRKIGLNPAQLTKMLKAVKASGKADTVTAKKIVADAMDDVLEMARKRGWGQDDIDYLEGALIDYGAGYSFGKGHSVTYGVVAYNTAYLATHYPLQFWMGMLNAYMGSKNSKGDSLEPIYWKAAYADGVRVKNPHVNHSEVGYVIDPEQNAIIKGLLSVHNVGLACAEELVAKRPFATLIDLAQRVNGKVTGAKALLTATSIDEVVYKMVVDEATGGHIEKELEHAVASLYKAGALSGIPFGEPIRRAKGRIRRCKECKHTFSTPLEYEDHVEEVHSAEDQPAAV